MYPLNPPFLLKAFSYFLLYYLFREVSSKLLYFKKLFWKSEKNSLMRPGKIILIFWFIFTSFHFLTFLYNSNKIFGFKQFLAWYFLKIYWKSVNIEFITFNLGCNYSETKNFSLKNESGTEIGNSLEFDFIVPPPNSWVGL